MVNRPAQKGLLYEQLEWLVKMGFTIEDIMEWAQSKKKLGDVDGDGTFTKNSSNSNNNNSTLSANSESTLLQQPSFDITLLPNSSGHAHTEPPRLQELPSTPSPPPALTSPSGSPLMYMSRPVDSRSETQTPSKLPKSMSILVLWSILYRQVVLGGSH